MRSIGIGLAGFLVTVSLNTSATSWTAPDAISLTVDNDLYVGEDNGYTNGTFISWARDAGNRFSPETMPGWVSAMGNALYIGRARRKHRAVSYLVGQATQTPNDILREDLVEDDLPYVGLLLWRATLHAYDQRVADRLSLTLGMVGPASGAKKTQKWVHKLSDSENPRGWDNQIDNEPVFEISAERSWRLLDVPVAGNTGFDVIGTGTVGVGTLQSHLASGISFRFGSGLDRTFPTATLLPNQEVYSLRNGGSDWNVFVNLRGEFAANDVTIDGNTFRESHSVPLEHWRAQAVLGFALSVRRWALGFSTAWVTDRHTLQEGPGNYGSFNISYCF